MERERDEHNSESADDGPQEDINVHRITIRTPPFNKERPALWFASLEAQFFINKITQETTKFHFAVAHLDTECTKEVEDLIIAPPDTNPYMTLKKTIIARFSDSFEEKVRRLLEREQLGDRRPSSFFRHLKSLAGPSFPDDLLRSIWSSRLPRQLQIILAAQKLNTSSELADLADQLIELTDRSPEVCKVSAEPTLASMQRQIEELTRTVAALSVGGHRRGRDRSHSRSRRTPRSRSRPRDLCWYHERYGAKANKCLPNCKWTSRDTNSLN